MKKTSFILLLIVLISLLIISCGTKEISDTGDSGETGTSLVNKTSKTVKPQSDLMAEWGNFSSPGHNMTLKYPPNWSKQERPSGQIIVRFSNQGTKLSTGAIIDKVEIIEQEKTSESLDEYIQKTKNTITNSFKGTIISEGETKVGGIDAKYVVFEYALGYEFKSKKIFLEKSGIFLTFDLVSQKSEYESNAAQFSSIVGTVKFD